jgi:acetylornithine deacetylase/succinyl-diaminopimelate desuccinylase-like protein
VARLSLSARGPPEDPSGQRAAGASLTCGTLQVWPGAANVIPGRVSLTLDFRDPDRERLATLRDRLEAAAMATAAAHGVTAAGHDAQNMAHLGPTGMIFVPSRGGRSHAADEYTSFDAIAAGADVLLATLLELARGDHP